MTKFSIVVAATFIPLIVLTRWTLVLTPGGGPQGGEAIYLGWFMVALWFTFISLISTVKYVPSGSSFKSTKSNWHPPRSDGYRRLKGSVCTNRPIRQDALDEVVWRELL
ncbi:MAG: hypothetical protein HY650_00595, partial [Acidobacteria bacterium]|nr:hypothetical protein [Acidobacteriota bacterium]